MAAESETNSLTMKLLALSNYCEGPKANEIKNVISKLPGAAYRERMAADEEVARLREENAQLKQRLAIEVLVNGQSARPPRPSPAHVWNPRNGRHSATSRSSSVTTPRDNRLTPPRSRDLFSDSCGHSIKRRREESSPAPPRPPKRPRPMCTGCFQVGGACDGKSECGICRTRKYGCEYNECREGSRCVDRDCTRLHPEQWDLNEEPKRLVKPRGR